MNYFDKVAIKNLFNMKVCNLIENFRFRVKISLVCAVKSHVHDSFDS